MDTRERVSIVILHENVRQKLLGIHIRQLILILVQNKREETVKISLLRAKYPMGSGHSIDSALHKNPRIEWKADLPQRKSNLPA